MEKIGGKRENIESEGERKILWGSWPLKGWTSENLIENTDQSSKNKKPKKFVDSIDIVKAVILRICIWLIYI